MAENAREIRDTAREFYDRAVKFGDHLAKVGRGLTSAVNAYNSAIGSYQGRVLPAGQRLESLKVTDASRKLKSGATVDGNVRVLSTIVEEE
jgi:DNA recombination protein RmuC